MTQAAIASKQAARNFGLTVLKEKLNDLDKNFTRFVIISHEKVFQEKADKISVCFEVPHESGTLYNILGHFIFNGLNMTRIESRPIQGKPWQYRFFVDFNGNLREQGREKCPSRYSVGNRGIPYSWKLCRSGAGTMKIRVLS